MIRQLAHEIKNPLGGLRGAAQLLARELHDPTLHEYTGVIIGEADRLTALVDSIAGPGRPPLRSLVNVHELCEHVFHLLRGEARASVLVERDYDPEPAERHARSQPDHPGIAQRRAQRAAGARRARARHAAHARAVKRQHRPRAPPARRQPAGRGQRPRRAARSCARVSSIRSSPGARTARDWVLR